MKRIFIKTTIACFIAGLTLSGCEKDETANKSVSVSGVSLNETSITLTAGDTLVLTATVAPDNAANKTLAWTSSDAGIASVVAGTVVALAAGKATITVGTVDGGKTASCTVTVNEALVPVDGVSLSATDTTLTPGETAVLTATVAPYNASNKTLAWTSSDPEIVSVIAGTVAALAVGQAVITVGAADGGKTASCTVTVVPEITMATTADKVRIGFEISSSEAATVDWGDGNRQNITSVGFTFYSHDYAASSDSRTITITGGKVTQLDCGGNRLTALDVSKGAKLETLLCSDNLLTALDVSANTALTHFYCHGNRLTALDVSANTALIHFYCRDNRLTALDAAANTALTHLDCEDNRLTAEALNALFETLHDNKGHSKSVFVSNNPGEAECDKGIAERKEWSVATRLN